ncbi:C-C chemokine receptor type 8-like [Siphateles boraxobius]|uniref:C-C chemokine receptor type 8-like n=1 Tax=Siphateles boraxobius TaxID=180520 RepID=UPI004063D73E
MHNHLLIREALSMNISTENFNSTEVHPSTIIQESLILTGFRIGLLGFNLLFGVPTHSYVLLLIARRRRIPSEIFNVNLTVCEIIYSFVFLKQILPSLELIYPFLQGLGITGRPLFHCLMCVERYLAVVHPVTFLKYKPLRYRVICCTAVWITTLGSCSAATTIQILSNQKTYIWFFSLQFLLFLSIQLFCLVAVLRALKQSGPGERGREREEENHMKKRAFHLILITTVTLVVMFVPFVITGFLTVLQQQEPQRVSLIWFLGPCCFILAGFVQPVLYLHRVGELFCLCSS